MKNDDPMQPWYERVDALSDAGRENFTRDELKKWLKELHEGGAEKRNRARAKWAYLVPYPTIIVEYLRSLDEEDGYDGR